MFQNAGTNTLLPSVGGQGDINGTPTLDPSITHVIRNSFASGELDPGDLRGKIGGGLDLADHSYLANLGLWDDYFLSGTTTGDAPIYKSPSAAAVEKENLRKFLRQERDSPKGQGHNRYSAYSLDPEKDLETIWGTTPGAAPEASGRVAANIMV